LPVYCFDPRFYDKQVKSYDIKKCGLIRTKFNVETVANFRAGLESIGSKPEDYLKTLVDPKIKTTVVYQQESCSEELAVED
jgi:hypothetical protein